MTTITDIQKRLEIVRKLTDPTLYDSKFTNWYIRDVTFLLSELKAVNERIARERAGVPRKKGK